ncbi:MAG TPA: DUF4928 family protein [Fimbriimonadaceae bacterium]|nr:DUF4928 family protein [Fimbriimonadaceae bacterium]HRI72957.1 DUF4928 family protein [Fimbriimonadaceae bacterium]
MSIIEPWYNSLKKYSGSFPSKGTIAGALVVLESLKRECDLSIESHTASGGSQIIGASGAAVKHILESYQESREFVSEGGRTNRGLRGDIKNLLNHLATEQIDQLSEPERLALLCDAQRYLVDRVRDWHSRQRLKVTYNESHTTREFVSSILALAREKQQQGPVAQYLVGAKLQIRFPHLDIDNDSYSTADSQLGRKGDFMVGDTAFHVTVSPMDKVYDRCRENLSSGLRTYLLVPGSILQAAQTNASSVADGRISVESIESFVGGNVDELAQFSKSELLLQVRELIRTYNARVDAVEIDKGMLIELPHNLEPHVRRAR